MSLPESSTYRAAGLLGPSWIRGIWSPSAHETAPLGGRDDRLDMFRGLALVMIFINHVPGTVYEAFTNRNFGFSDAAEAFVFMSGLAAGLAYSSRFRTGNLWAATAKVWARARQLYFVHLTITFICLAIFAGFAKWFDLPDLLTKNNIAPLFQQPLSTIVGIPLLTHQLGYLNILPLYMTLLFVTPLVILAGLRHPWLVLVASVALWAIGGQFRINFPAFPNPGGWFFNPFSWQLLFVLGLLSGMAMKTGQRFIPFNTALYALCAAFLVFVLLWMKITPFGLALNKGLGWLNSIGVPFYITNFDKTFLSAPRLLHALALFYVLGHLPVMRQVAASWWATPLRLMGRQGLATFAIGTVFSILLQSIRAGLMPNPLIDAALLGTGLLVLVLIAWALTRTAELTRAKPPVAT
ncbi:MAG: OpgC domain-containing protein [Candidatus Devosia phytovorans]|uniref:OpgC domain-containing protein n=1 Tax=Candidatus Devosia phytovorans TaxID=3121372 RepID=A0AAJ6B0F7_9HYPH|nr:OpgC domain-containing protein [Devosia sp.]WEK05660.1 MAG: OpgC domain-containing protein [Devosia sp.]